MFSVDFFERPSITELKEHDWCKGPVPTHSEVILEYIERYTLYAEYSLNNQMDFPQINEEKLTQVCVLIIDILILYFISTKFI